MTAQPFVSLVPDARPMPKTDFERTQKAFLDDFFQAFPTWATGIGYHAVDDRWSDVTDAGREARIAMFARHRAALSGLSDDALSRDERTDRDILLEQLDALEFDDAVLRETSWDALLYVYSLGSGFFGLLSREFGPWAHRGSAFVHRLLGVPAVLEAAKANLVGLPDRPVSLLHLDTALSQLFGVSELIDEGITEAKARAKAGDSPELVGPMESAAEVARAAVEDFRVALDTDVRTRASGEGRLGADVFQQKLRHTLSSDLTHEELRERAWRDYHATRGEMLRLAHELWSTWVPGEDKPTEGDEHGDLDSRIVRRVLDAIAAEHREPAELLDWCTEEVRNIEAYCRANNVIGLPDEPLKVTWTPVFMRAYGRAFLDSPGPLEKGQTSHFWITPPDASATEEDVASYMREDNDRMLRLLCIHEGVPGHYLQLAWSNRSPSLARAIFSNGMFAEGWAVYVEQVMLDLGYGAHEGALLLSHWKFYLRAITNAIMDVEIHAGSMDERGAMDLMVKGGFQEPDEAKAKWLRARLSSTQLVTYYLGALEMMDIEVEARRRAASAAGAAPDAVSLPRLYGQIGATPGFDYRRHMESVISHGTPPIKWVAKILREDAGAAVA
ncbi:MAG: DUF885 domain-containing protein [Candidatus Limnocylindrales bacterium]